MALSVEHGIGRSFSDIQAVERVHVIRDGITCTVFTVIDDDDEEAIDRIYNQERFVIHQFPGLHFDFNVIARRGRPLDTILSLAPPVWQR